MEPEPTRPEISVVIPIFNEEQIIPELHQRLTNVVKALGVSYEILLIDDGSTDRTLTLLKEYAEKDRNLKFISFSRNFGHQSAITAGLFNAIGNAVVIMDGDLQDPPELIPKLYDKLKEGYKVVYAKRAAREGESFFKKVTAAAFYRLLKRITSIDIPLDTGDFRIITSEVVDHLKQMSETNKYYRGQIAWLGFKQTYIDYERERRAAGNTKFTVRKMMKFALDGITSFSNFPLQIASFLGFFFSLVAFLIILYALYSKFILQEVITGWTSLIISTMFIGSIQLFCIGIIGEYISRISNDVKNRPPYIIDESNL